MTHLTPGHNPFKRACVVSTILLATLSSLAFSETPPQATGTPEHNAALHLQRGHQMRRAKQWLTATAAYQTAAAMDGQLSEALFWQAYSQLRSGNTSAALTTAKHYLRDIPGSPKGWQLLAEICRLERDYGNAAYALEQAIRLDNTLPAQVFLNRAYLQDKHGESPQRILRGLDQALIRHPGNGKLLARAIRIAHQQRDWPLAEYYWHQASADVKKQPAMQQLRRGFDRTLLAQD